MASKEPRAKKPDRLALFLKDITARTIDGTQGKECAICILDLTATHKSGFVKDLNRLTVALSRAKSGLYIIGNEKAMLQDPTLRPREGNSPMLAKMVSYLRWRKWIVNLQAPRLDDRHQRSTRRTATFAKRGG
ncbi:hypothetical protein FQN57_006768 [Myotisia sp. PD_48]|nr:hypothetical protein FQN57_006768 [Myotisia sp. PD_48]